MAQVDEKERMGDGLISQNPNRATNPHCTCYRSMGPQGRFRKPSNSKEEGGGTSNSFDTFNFS